MARPALLLAAACLAATCRTGSAMVCGFPGRPRDGNSTPPMGVKSRPGDTAHYSCRPGYTLFGEEERVCLAEGLWAGHMPLCMLNLALGQSATAADSMLEEIAALAVDGDINTCAELPRSKDQRWWQVELPHYTHVGSVSLNLTPDTYQELTIYVVVITKDLIAMYMKCADFKGRFQSQKMTFQCNGDEGQVGQYLYVRDDRHDYDHFVICEVEVFAYRGRDRCGDPEEPAWGNVTIQENGTAFYECYGGYSIYGDEIRYCGSDGTWSELTPTCTEIACGQPTRYENSYVNLVNGTSTVDSVAVYTCKPGHLMSAESTKTMIVCLEGGIWEDPDFTCEADGEVLPVLFGVKEFESNDFSNDKNPKGLGTTGIVSTTALCVFLLILLSVAAACVVKRYQTFKENQASSAANSDCSYDNDKESLSNIEILNNTTAVPAISYGDHRIYNDVLPPIIEAEEPLEMKSLHGSYGDISGGDFRRNNFMYANRATGMPELHIAGASTSFTRPESPNSRCCYKTADSPESVITHTCPNIPNDRTVNNVRESEIKDKLPWSIPTSIKSFFSLTKKFSDNGQTNRVDLRQPKENNKVGNGAIRRTIEPQCHRITNTAKQNSNQYRDVETGVRDYVMIDFKSDDVPDLTPYGSTIASYNSDVL